MSYAISRHAKAFLETHAEYKFSCTLLGMAQHTHDNELRNRALKACASQRRQRKLAKDKLDRLRREGV